MSTRAQLAAQLFRLGFHRLKTSTVRQLGEVIVSVILGLMAPGAAGFESDPAVVDESIALNIGGFEVSQYIVDKNFNQFFAAHLARYRAQPSRSEVEEWFRLFLAQQAIKAQLHQTGYVNRPEVRDAVARMSRRILTQTNGPLYQTFYDPKPIPVERLQAVHKTSARVFDALIVRFENESSAAHLIGLESSRDTLEQRLIALAGARSASALDFHDGRIVWPYHPFEEITDDLLGAEPGRLLGPLPRKLGVYFLLVRHETSQPIPGFSTAQQGLDRYVRDLDELMVRQLRRRRILRECDFSIAPEAAAQLGARMFGADIGPQGVPDSAITEIADIPLASYILEGGRHRISASDFVRHFNRRIIRQRPRDSAALTALIEDMVVEEFDYHSALAAGLDRQAKFVQDQRNFESNQALDLYEQETLAPQIALSRDDLETYYAQQREHYRELFGATAASARANKIGDPAPGTHDGPRQAASQADSSVLSVPDGQESGSLGHSGDPAGFVQRLAVLQPVPPLAQIEGVVRRDLLRAKLDALELDLLRRNGGFRAIRIRLGFAKYGIEDPTREFPGGAIPP